jgi:hypothetical protein
MVVMADSKTEDWWWWMKMTVKKIVSCSKEVFNVYFHNLLQNSLWGEHRRQIVMAKGQYLSKRKSVQTHR